MGVKPTKSVKIDESVHKKVASYVAVNGGQISDFIERAIEEKLQAELVASIGGREIAQRLATLEELVRSQPRTETAAIDLSVVESKVMSLMEIIGVPMCAVWEMLAEATQNVTGEDLQRVKSEFMALGKMTYIEQYKQHLLQHEQRPRIYRKR